MFLRDKNREKLKNAGLTIFESEKGCFFVKKTGLPGNSIPDCYKSGFYVGLSKEKITTDCPTLDASIVKEHFQLECWEWTPGPGPGDFRINFENEDLLVDFVYSYYFGENTYFDEKKNHFIPGK